MERLPLTATDDQLIDVAHQWVRLLEAQEYEKAFAFTQHESTGWTADHLRQFIESYGDAELNQRVTIRGAATDISQRVEVTRWPEKNGAIGELWYDLNINGLVSDVTATFYICVVPDGLILSLNDVHVM